MLKATRNNEYIQAVTAAELSYLSTRTKKVIEKLALNPVPNAAKPPHASAHTHPQPPSGTCLVAAGPVSLLSGDAVVTSGIASSSSPSHASSVVFCVLRFSSSASILYLVFRLCPSAAAIAFKDYTSDGQWHVLPEVMNLNIIIATLLIPAWFGSKCKVMLLAPCMEWEKPVEQGVHTAQAQTSSWTNWASTRQLYIARTSSTAVNCIPTKFN